MITRLSNRLEDVVVLGSETHKLVTSTGLYTRIQEIKPSLLKLQNGWVLFHPVFFFHQSLGKNVTKLCADNLRIWYEVTCQMIFHGTATRAMVESICAASTTLALAAKVETALTARNAHVVSAATRAHVVSEAHKLNISKCMTGKQKVKHIN